MLTAGVATGMSILPMEAKQKKQLSHHVFFWLKNPNSKEDFNKLIEGLRSLKAVETVKDMHIGVPASTEKRDVVDGSYSVSLLLFFDDAAAEKVYQVHPIHEAFVKNHSQLWEKVIVYDSIGI